MPRPRGPPAVASKPLLTASSRSPPLRPPRSPQQVSSSNRNRWMATVALVLFLAASTGWWLQAEATAAARIGGARPNRQLRGAHHERRLRHEKPGASVSRQLLQDLSGNQSNPEVTAFAPKNEKSSTLAQGALVSEEGPAGKSGFRPMSTFFTSPDKVDDMAGMVTPKGYGIQRHDVTTTDGYKIVNFRIPRGKGQTSGPIGPPVLLIHGISLASTCWVVNDPDESLAFILADKGYDVWMTNTRGNTFSREHTKYSIASSSYWAFSADEMALIDLPATIDYMLKVTGYKQIAFVGHSQGGTLLLMLAAAKPWYNDAVSVNVNIAPVVYAKYILSPVLVGFFGTTGTLSLAANSLPAQQFFYMSPAIQAVFLNGACQVPVTVPSCVLATESMFGNSKHITTSMYMKYWRAWPSPTSYWNALQWSQIYNEPKPRFFKFNYGDEYDLFKITIPTVFFSAGNDVLAGPGDTSLVREKLGKAGCLKGDHFLDDYSHMDFIWDSKGAKTRVYPIVLDALKMYPPTPVVTISSDEGSGVEG